MLAEFYDKENKLYPKVIFPSWWTIKQVKNWALWTIILCGLKHGWYNLLNYKSKDQLCFCYKWQCIQHNDSIQINDSCISIPVFFFYFRSFKLLLRILWLLYLHDFYSSLPIFNYFHVFLTSQIHDFFFYTYYYYYIYIFIDINTSNTK